MNTCTDDRQAVRINKSGATTIVEVTYSTLMEQARPMARAHYDEVCGDVTDAPFALHDEMYAKLEEAGVFFILAAYQDKTLIGYSSNAMNVDLHSKDTTSVMNDSLYVDRAWRNSPIGLRLMKATEEAAKQRGATLMVWPARPATVMSKILEYRGYDMLNVIYSKEL